MTKNSFVAEVTFSCTLYKFFWRSFLTACMPLFSFYTSLKTEGFLMFSGSIERDQWHETGQWQL